MSIQVLVVLGIAAALYWNSTKSPAETFRSRTNVAEGPLFRMYKASWCGHCQNALPSFQPLVGAQTVNGQRVRVDVVDIDKDKQRVKIHPLVQETGVPLFVYYDSNGRETIFKGDRTTAAFRNFLQQVVKA